MSFIGIGSPIPEIANLPGQGGAIEVLLNYSSAAECEGDLTPLTPTQAEPAGGVFSASPSGLNINTSTGVITPAGSTPNTYTITYTVSGESSSFTFTINPLQQSTFSYSSSSLEQYGTASPIFASSTTTGGTFSATSGLVINTTTGVLDLANSTIGGPYTVTYTTPGPCATSSTFNVSVTALSTSLVDNNFAMEFNGSDEYVSFNSLITTIQSETKGSISAWIKFDESAPSASQTLIAFSTTAVTRSYIHAYLNTTSPTLSFQYRYNGTTQWRVNTSAALSNNVWYHVCLIQNGTEPEIYINGVKVSQSFDVTTDKTKWWDDFTLQTSETGRSYYNNGGSLTDTNYFNGDIDEVAIWNRALELADVQRIYNGSSTSGKAANLFSTGLSNGLVYWNRMGD